MICMPCIAQGFMFVAQFQKGPAPEYLTIEIPDSMAKRGSNNEAKQGARRERARRQELPQPAVPEAEANPYQVANNPHVVTYELMPGTEAFDWYYIGALKWMRLCFDSLIKEKDHRQWVREGIAMGKIEAMCSGAYTVKLPGTSVSIICVDPYLARADRKLGGDDGVHRPWAGSLGA